jgi:hypothetical protein
MDLNHICIVIDDTLLHWDNICSDHNETVSLSQTQEHAVLKDAELSRLVPLAAARCQRRQRSRQPRRYRCGVGLGCRGWSQPPSSSAVATLPRRDRRRVSK